MTDENRKIAEASFKTILQILGEDTDREGLQETPKRYVKFMEQFMSVPEPAYTCFEPEDTDQMIIQRNIPFFSLCEHHTAPFFGFAAVAYIPNKKIVGLSKLARTVDFYSRRFQNQERITNQVAERIMNELDPKGVAVHITAQHFCMAMRGVEKHNTWTDTTKLKGVFLEDANAKAEFLSAIQNGIR